MAREPAEAPAISEPAGNVPAPADETGADRGQGQRDDGGDRGPQREPTPPDGDEPSGAARGASGSGGDGEGGPTKPHSDAAVEELEAAAEELLEGEGGKPGHGGGGSDLGQGLLDGGNGGGSANPLEEACLDPDECPGIEPGG